MLPGNIPMKLYDSGSENPGERIVIFAMRQALKWLGNSRHWDSDGTFRVTPTTLSGKFGQFYSFHGQVREHVESGVVTSYKFPLVFALMEKRDTIGFC